MQVVWDGQQNTDMLSGLNWSANAAPSASDDVVINGGGGTRQPVLGFSNAATYASVAISAGSLTMNGQLTTFGGVTISGTGRMIIGAGADLFGNLTVNASLNTMLNNGVIFGNVVYNGLGSRFINEGKVTGSITFMQGGTYESSVDGDANVIGSGSVEKAVLNRAAFGIAFDVDLSDGGGGRFIGDGTRLTAFDVLDIRGGSAGDRFTGGGLFDNLVGNAGNDTLNGNAGADNLSGGADHDLLNGGTGADTMDGGSGDDGFTVDDVGDVVLDSSGLDAINVSLSSYSLVGGTIEDLFYVGAGTFKGIGNILNNTMMGGQLNDVLNGGGGADLMIGLTGNDIYVISSDSDVVMESVDEGVDTVQRSNGDLFLFNFLNVENARLTGTGGYRLFGNDGNNVLTGNSADNVISGGMGADILTGGKGADRFVFEATAQSQPGQRDRIMDFALNDDLVDLLKIDARVSAERNNAFVWIGQEKFSGLGAVSEGELRFEKQGVNTVVLGDTNGDGKAELLIALLGDFSLSDADFIL